MQPTLRTPGYLSSLLALGLVMGSTPVVSGQFEDLVDLGILAD